MADRKSLNHYYPPDFDPSKIPRRKLGKDRQQVVRLMAPFSMRCNTCGEYIYKGKKFNARKETVQGEDYYGLKIFRFYIKCTQCSAEITFKTDPKNTDYVAEHGASRNFEPWREDDDPNKGLTEEEILEKKLESLEADPMKQLEDRTLDSRREMEIMDALQDIRTRNAKLEKVDTEAVLARLHGKNALVETPEDIESKLAQEEDEALVRKYFGKALDVSSSSSIASGSRATLNGDDRHDRLIVHSDDDGDEDGESDTISHARDGAPAKAITVKRKFLDEESDDKEPDVHTLLAMKSGQNGLSSASSSSTPASKSTSSSSLGIKPTSLPPPKKKKNAPNPLGLVRKKPAATATKST